MGRRRQHEVDSQELLAAGPACRNITTLAQAYWHAQAFTTAIRALLKTLLPRLSPSETVDPPLSFGGGMSSAQTGPRVLPRNPSRADACPGWTPWPEVATSEVHTRASRESAGRAVSLRAWFLPGESKRVSGDPDFREVGDS